MSKLGLRGNLMLGASAFGFLWFASAAAEELPSPTTLIVPMIVIVVLVIINGLFVAAEFAIIGVRASRVEQMADEGSGVARKVLQTLDSPRRQDRYIATAQLGITIASLGLGMYGEPNIAHFIEPYLALLTGAEPTPAIVHTVATILGLGLITYLHVVVGEMVPKTIALTQADRAVLLVQQPMRVSQMVLNPAVTLLNSIGNGLLRLFRVPPAQGEARLHSPEELELIVSESAGEGLLNEEEEEMILNIFDFGERSVGQVMTPRRKVQAVPLEMPLPDLLKFVAQSSYSRFPVYEGDLDHVIGILHLKDLVRHWMRSQNVADMRLLLRPAPAVPEYQPVEKLLAVFKQQRLHMAIVLDEFGGMAGIVTLEDLIEEIVGEVRDEFDVEKEPLTRLGPGVIEVTGSYLLDDLVDNVYLGEEEDLPDVETVGGLIVAGLGRPPRLGDELAYGDIQFTILDVDGLAVARARVEYPVVDEYAGEDGAGTGNGAQHH